RVRPRRCRDRPEPKASPDAGAVEGGCWLHRDLDDVGVPCADRDGGHAASSRDWPTTRGVPLVTEARTRGVPVGPGTTRGGPEVMGGRGCSPTSRAKLEAATAPTPSVIVWAARTP